MGYEKIGNTFKELLFTKIDPYERNTFIDKWSSLMFKEFDRTKEGLKRQLQSKDYSELTENPFLLTMTCWLYTTEKELPKGSKWQILGKFINNLFEKSKKTYPHNSIRYTDALPHLHYIAYYLHEEQKKHLIKENEILELIDKAYKRHNKPRNFAIDKILPAILQTNILIKKGEDRSNHEPIFEFIHKNFLEYLSGAAQQSKQYQNYSPSHELIADLKIHNLENFTKNEIIINGAIIEQWVWPTPRESESTFAALTSASAEQINLNLLRLINTNFEEQEDVRQKALIEFSAKCILNIEPEKISKGVVVEIIDSLIETISENDCINSSANTNFDNIIDKMSNSSFELIFEERVIEAIFKSDSPHKLHQRLILYIYYLECIIKNDANKELYKIEYDEENGKNILRFVCSNLGFFYLHIAYNREIEIHNLEETIKLLNVLLENDDQVIRYSSSFALCWASYAVYFDKKNKSNPVWQPNLEDIFRYIRLIKHSVSPEYDRYLLILLSNFYKEESIQQLEQEDFIYEWAVTLDTGKRKKLPIPKQILKEDEIIQLFFDFINHPKTSQRDKRRIALRMAEMGIQSTSITKYLINLVSDITVTDELKNPARLCLGLSQSYDSQSMIDLVACLCHESERVRGDAIISLSGWNNNRLIEPLINILYHPNPITREYSATVLGTLTDNKAIDYLQKLIKKETDQILLLEERLKVQKDTTQLFGEIESHKRVRNQAEKSIHWISENLNSQDKS